MDSRHVLIRLKILDAINADTFEEAKSILQHALLETSQHWQENAMAAGLATEEDFFFDTYVGTNPTLLAMNKS